MRFASLFLLTILTACVSAPKRAVPPELASVRAECQKLVADGKVPSISVAVARHGRVIWEEAFGYQDLEARKPATIDTMYTLASTGKSITGTAILSLAAKGIIDLDAPVDRYLAPDHLTVYEGDASAVTVRTLLKMGAGVPHLWWHHWTDRAETPLSNRELIRRYAMVVTPPDGGMYYSNLTYGVLAQIAENATHIPFANVVRREVFEPFSMHHSSLDPDPRFGEFLAKSYGGKNELRPYRYSDPVGGAGYRASIDDLIRYAIHHLDDRKLAAIHEKDGYFAGWGNHIPDKSGIRFSLANGGIVGATSEIRLVPEEGIAVACLTNLPGVDVSSIINDAIAALEPRYQKQFDIPDSFREHPFVADATLAGTWKGDIRWWEKMLPAALMIADDGSVSLSIDGSPVVKLTKMRVENGFIRGTCACTLPMSDAAGPAELEIAVRHDGDRLFGSARLISTAPRSDFSLPAYIGLRLDRTAARLLQ